MRECHWALHLPRKRRINQITALYQLRKILNDLAPLTQKEDEIPKHCTSINLGTTENIHYYQPLCPTDV